MAHVFTNIAALEADEIKKADDSLKAAIENYSVALSAQDERVRHSALDRVEASVSKSSMLKTDSNLNLGK
eukprot:4967313-Amphidinium_carterae.1